MGVPTRFAIEYPQRVSELIADFEHLARKRDLLGSFGLLVASAVLTIPYERMKHGHFLYGVEDADLGAAFKALEKGHFLEAPFWRGADPGVWREFRIAGEGVDEPEHWREIETGLHPFDPRAHDSIGGHAPENVIRLIRNALSHGNIIYLDNQWREREGERMQFMAFLTPYPDPEDARPTFRLLVTGEEEFLHFVRSWAKWIGGFPLNRKLDTAAGAPHAG
jgi:hypothetical protein